MYIVEASDKPILIDEGFINKYKEKPFKGKFSNMKLVIRKFKTENVDPDRLIKYIESNILPQLERILDYLADSTKGLIHRDPARFKKYKERIYKSCKSLVLSNGIIDKCYLLKVNCLIINTEITFKGDISEDGKDIDFKLYDIVETTYMVV